MQGMRVPQIHRTVPLLTKYRLKFLRIQLLQPQRPIRLQMTDGSFHHMEVSATTSVLKTWLRIAPFTVVIVAEPERQGLQPVQIGHQVKVAQWAI